MRSLQSSILICVLGLPVAGWAQPAPPPIIDVHMHAMEGDPRFGIPLAHELTGETFAASADAKSHFEECTAEMRRWNVVRAVVDGTPHEAVLHWREKAGERVLIGYGFDDPSMLDAAFARREHAAGRLQVFGEIGAQYAGLAPDDARLEPLFALAEELDVPVGLHLHPGPPGAAYPPFEMTKMRAGNGNPLLLEDALVRHPKLRLYIMHAGWPFLDETVALLYAHPQVYVEVGVIDWSQPRAEFHRYLRRLVEAGYGRRVMFGSDQMVWPGTLTSAVEAVQAAEFLDADQKRDIFCRNAARFLRLDAKLCEVPPN